MNNESGYHIPISSSRSFRASMYCRSLVFLVYTSWSTFVWWGTHDVYTALARVVGAEELPDTFTGGVSCKTVRDVPGCEPYDLAHAQTRVCPRLGVA